MYSFGDAESLLEFFIEASKPIGKENTCNELEWSDVPLDVIFVAAPKDFEVLTYSVNSVKELFKQPISKMVLIAPKSEEAIKLSTTLNIEYIDEDTILNKNDFINWAEKSKLSKNAGNWKWFSNCI